jgi:hypothetical protein
LDGLFTPWRIVGVGAKMPYGVIVYSLDRDLIESIVEWAAPCGLWEPQCYTEDSYVCYFDDIVDAARFFVVMRGLAPVEVLRR